MIPTADSAYTVTSTHAGRTKKMGIADGALNHVMDLLAGVYQDTITALIREYSTNGLDAHREAGVSLPVEIFLPTALRPTFEVRDSGVGMSGSDIEANYAMYGASTKRESNEAVGMMGIGCKAALAYTNQFTINTVRDGVRSVVVISRDEEGGGTTTSLSETPTDEANGTSVVIPVKSGDSAYFERKAQDFFSYWEPGSVLVDGEEPAKVWETAHKISETMCVDALPDDQVTVVMGSVPYPLNVSKLNLPHSSRLIVKVPLGKVMPTPAREGLREEADSTRQLAAEIARELAEVQGATMEAAMKAARSKPEAAAAAARVCLETGCPPSAAVYRGEDIELDKRHWGFDGYTSHRESAWRGNGFHRLHGRYRGNSLTIRHAVAAVWVSGYSNKSANSKTMDKALKYLKSELDLTPPAGVILTDGDEIPSAFAEWVSPESVIRYEDLRKWRDPDQKRATSAPTADTYNTFRWHGESQTIRWSKSFPASEIDSSEKLYYLAGAQSEDDSQTAKLLLESGSGSVVRLPQSRLKKFLRLFPEAEDGGAALKTRAGEWWKALSTDERRAVKFWSQNEERYWNRVTRVSPKLFREFTAKKLADPELRRLVTYSQKWTRELESAADAMLAHLDPKLWERTDLKLSLDSLSARYAAMPLSELHHSFRYGDNRKPETVIAHVTLYANAVWAAAEAGAL